MNFKRIGRMFLCLLLVCCLLLQASPIKAYATGMEGILGGLIAPVPAPIVIGSILIGLGITAVETGVFEELVGFVEDKLEAAGEVVNGMIDTWVVSDGDTETYTVSEELIQGTLDGAVESGMISSNNAAQLSISAMVPFKYGPHGLTASIDCPAFLYNYYGSPVIVAYTTNPDVIFYSTDFYNWYDYPATTNVVDINGVTYYYHSATCMGQYCPVVPVDYNFAPGKALSAFITGELDFSVSEITSVEGLDTSGLVTIDTSVLEEAYKEWSKNKVNKPDSNDSNKKMPYWPIAPADDIYELLEKSQEDVWNGVHDYTTTVLSNWDILLNTLTGIKNFIKSLLNVQTWIQAVVDAIELAKETVVECFEFLTEGVQNILDFLKDISLSIFQPVLDALKDAFLVRDGYFESKISNLRQKYSFVDSILGFCLGIRDVCLGIGSEPPILYIDLAAAEGSVNWGQRVVFVDLTWYSRYKPYGDAIISAFLWAMFSWRVLHMIPGLINGTTGIVGSFRFRHGGGD